MASGLPGNSTLDLAPVLLLRAFQASHLRPRNAKQHTKIYHTQNRDQSNQQIINLSHINLPNVYSRRNGLCISLRMSLSEPTAALRHCLPSLRTEEPLPSLHNCESWGTVTLNCLHSCLSGCFKLRLIRYNFSQIVGTSYLGI